MSSRSRPYGRSCLKVRALFDVLADEAEGGTDETRGDAIHNLRELAPFPRMMLLGLVADLAHEHLIVKEWQDTDDPDPSEIISRIDHFLHRCQVLFGDGLVMSEDMHDTFTA